MYCTNESDAFYNGRTTLQWILYMQQQERKQSLKQQHQQHPEHISHIYIATSYIYSVVFQHVHVDLLHVMWTVLYTGYIVLFTYKRIT